MSSVAFPPGSNRRPVSFPRVVIALATALLLLALSACVSREDTTAAAANESVDTAELAGVTLRVGDQKGGTEALLRASGELDDLPYEVEFSTFTSGPPQIEAATAGQIDFAVTGNTPPIFGAAAGANVRIVAAYTNSAGGDQIIAPVNSPLASVADLAGRRVAVARGSSAHGHLLIQLRNAGLTLGEDVEPVFLQPADALSAFTTGNVDAWAIWDPYTAIVALDPGSKTIITGEGVVNGFGFGVAGVAALEDPQRNTALEDFVVRIARASQWAVANIDQWGQLYAQEIDIDPRAGLEAQRRSVRPAIPLDESVVSQTQDLADAFAAAGQLDTDPVIADYVDDRYNGALTPFFGS